MKIPQRLLDIFPNTTINNRKLFSNLKKAGDILGRPMENRLIMGATAIFTQPYIDAHNKRVDTQTAQTSKNRTIGKIVAGTTVGCLVRGVIYNLIDKCTDTDLRKDSWKNLFTPRDILKHKGTDLPNKMLNYKTAIATILSLFVMLGATNILLDMPLTNKISNYLNKRDAEKNKNAGGKT